MKVIIPSVYERVQSENDPFELDRFGRATFAQNLTRLFENTNDGLVITINSQWGDGKTSFVRLFGQQLEMNDKFIPIYYDAFQNDFSADPFLSIAASIHEKLKDRIEKDGGDPKNRAQLDALKDLTKKLTKELVIRGSGLAVGLFTGGLVPIDGTSGWFEKKWIKFLSRIASVNVDEKFDSHIQAMKAISDFQEQLKKILGTGTDGEEQKIVFFVDELDRCRPDFAVQVIEKIKHLFNIDNVFFILAINKDQLLRTIANVYGIEEQDSQVYLQKFIHIETNLPAIEIGTVDLGISRLGIYLKELATLHELGPLFDGFDFEELGMFVSQKHLSLNPRGMDRTFSLISLAVGSSSPDFAINGLRAICVMSALKVSRPRQYEVWKSGSFNSLSPTEDSQPDKDNQKRVWEFLKNYFTNERDDTASNVFKVEVIPEVCRIIDIYEFPPITESLSFIQSQSQRPNLSPQALRFD